MTKEKYQTIFDNYINGNISEFRQGVKRLSKLELLNFLDYVGDLYGYGYVIRKCIELF